jgi:hypothetical protein
MYRLLIIIGIIVENAVHYIWYVVALSSIFLQNSNTIYVPINKQVTIIKNYLEIYFGVARERVKNFREQKFGFELGVV